MDDYIETTIRSIKAVNSAKSSVSTRTIETPIIPIIDFFRVLMDIRKVKGYWGKMVEADKTADDNFQDAKTEMNKVNKATKSFYEGLGKNGSNLSAQNINKLQSNLFNENALMESLLKKLDKEKILSENEMRILYYYIQNQLFDDERKETMDSIIHSIESNSDHIKTHLNDNVLQTEASLYEEILLTEMYLYTGNQHSEYSHLSREDKALLSSYLETLYNYRSALEEMKGVTWLKDLDPDEPLLARINQYDYKKSEDPQAFYIETNIIIEKGRATDFWGREDFFTLEDDDSGIQQFQSQISYYESGDDLQREHNLDARDEYANHTTDFIGQQLFSIAIDILVKGHPIASIHEAFENYHVDKSDKEITMTEGDAKSAANNFSLEIQILERTTHEKGRYAHEIKFLPTNETYEIMDRWKEVIDSGSNIPYPEKEISEENWFLISDFYFVNQSEIKSSFPEQYKYIFDE